MLKKSLNKKSLLNKYIKIKIKNKNISVIILTIFFIISPHIAYLS